MENNAKSICSQFSINPDQMDSVARDLNLKLIVLFGSWAKLNPLPGVDSDVDIALLGCPAENFWNCYKILRRFFSKNPLDLVRLETADPLFRFEVMNRSILIWGDPDLYCEYRAYAYRDFVDSADLFQLENNLFVKKMDYLAQQIYEKNY
ncbi:MAG: nucleotidyltransferase domain-containing protein [Spirochaetia bacterium]|nr:nucleotidyltransferase domain-containing protein [Spirochaetia bacterium]